MANDDLCWLSAVELARAIKRKKVSPVEVMDAVLARIARLDPTLHAYCTLTAETARRQARAAERAIMRKGARLGPLHGVPFSIKDMLMTKGVRTTFGSKVYADNIPEEDAPAVARLRAAGGILVGKTNTPAFGLLGSTRNLLFETTCNPWNPEFSPGGSSGGAGAAVAAGLAPLAVGTDSGGSVRIPASFCGIVGLKPSFGRVPLYPASATLQFDHAGPMTRTVADAALMLDVMAGSDARDLFSGPAEHVGYLTSLEGSLRGLRVAWSSTIGDGPGYGPVDPEVRSLCEAAGRRFKELGCRVETARLPWPNLREAKKVTYYSGIAARLLPYLPGRAKDMDAEIRSVIAEAKEWPATKYVDAWEDALALCDHARQFFTRYDLLLTPSVACPPYRVELDGPERVAGEPIADFYTWGQFSYPFNLTGQPAVSVPCGFTRAGLPVGLQIVGRRFEDAAVLRAAACFERAYPWVGRRPPVS